MSEDRSAGEVVVAAPAGPEALKHLNQVRINVQAKLAGFHGYLADMSLKLGKVPTRIENMPIYQMSKKGRFTSGGEFLTLQLEEQRAAWNFFVRPSERRLIELMRPYSRRAQGIIQRCSQLKVQLDSELRRSQNPDPEREAKLAGIPPANRTYKWGKFECRVYGDDGTRI